MRRLLIILGLIPLFLLTGCPPQTPTATPGGGFIIETAFAAYGANFVVPAPYSTISGTWVSDSSGATGDPSHFQVTTDGDALAAVANGRAPATWEFVWVVSESFPACAGPSVNTAPVALNGLEVIVCQLTVSSDDIEEAQPFIFSPNPINPASPPSTIHDTRFRIHVDLWDARGAVLRFVGKSYRRTSS